MRRMIASQRIAVGDARGVQALRHAGLQLIQYGGQVLLQRAGQGVTLLSCLAVALGTLGIYTLHIAPTLSFDAEGARIPAAPDLQRIEHLTLAPAFWQRLPEFLTPSAETAWWQLQEQVYRLLQAQDVVWVEIRGKDGVPSQVQAQVGLLPVLTAIEKVGLIYLAASIYVISAILAFRHHRAPPGTLLAFFLLAGALYLLSSAPVASRPITLHPMYFKLLISCVYTAAGGMITLVHFALVFPAPKALLRRWPWIPALLYGYFGLTVTLYLAGLTAFGTTFPFFCLCTGLMAWALCDTLVHERDRFLKQQIGLSLMAPVLVSLFLIGLNLVPVLLGLSPMPFTYFALLSLILPFALPLAMNNLALYQERRHLEQQANEERARVHRDLHDGVLGNLAYSMLTLQDALELLDRDLPQGRKDVHTALSVITRIHDHLRGVLPILRNSQINWEEFGAHLQECMREQLDPRAIDLEFDVATDLKALPSPSLQLKTELYHILWEAFVNALLHAEPSQITLALRCRGPMVSCEIRDDGRGFDTTAAHPGHYGLTNMQTRVEKSGGVWYPPQTREGQGTQVVFELPWGLGLLSPV